jgi:hypothetical protein
MEDVNITVNMTPEELQAASDKLKTQQAEMQQRLQALQQQQVTKAIAELQESAKQREQEAKDEEAVLSEIAHRRAQRLLDEEKEQKRIIEENRRLATERQKQADREASAQRAKEQNAAKLKREADQLHLLEQAERSLIAELAKPKVIAPVEERPATLASNPMAKILGWDVGSVAEKKVPEISYAEHVAEKAKADAERAILFPATQGPRPVDGNTLAALSAAFFDATQERANNDLLISLLSNFDASHVTKALGVIAEQHKVTRMSVQGIVTRMRMLLESQDGVVMETPSPVYAATPSRKELSKVACPVCAELVPYQTAYHCNTVINPRSARSAGRISSKECEELLAVRGER